MPVESPEERTVEVLLLPKDVDEELLSLYFENKRRSGGGPLISVEKKDGRAILVFEDAEGKQKTRHNCLGHFTSVVIFICDLIAFNMSCFQNISCFFF